MPIIRITFWPRSGSRDFSTSSVTRSLRSTSTRRTTPRGSLWFFVQLPQNLAQDPEPHRDVASSKVKPAHHPAHLVFGRRPNYGVYVAALSSSFDQHVCD